MSLKTDYAAGDPLPAEDVNNIVGAILQNTHNVIELFLENFFAAKVTAFNGLFFDGFSDETKADSDKTTLAADASSGQNELIIQAGDAALFDLLKEYIIFDATNKEAIEVASKVTGFAEQVDQSLATNIRQTASQTTTNDRFAQTFKVGTGLGGNLTEVTVELDSGSTPTLSFQVEIQTLSSGRPSGTVLTNGSSSIEPFFDGDVTFTFATPPVLVAGVSYAIVIIPQAADALGWRMRGAGSSDTLYPDGEAFGSNTAGSTWENTAEDTNNSSITSVNDLRFETKMQLDEKLILTGNLTNSYVATDDIQRSTVNFDAGGKKIDFTGINVGDDKEIVYYSEIQSFQTPKASARLWVVRNFTAQFNLDAGISGGATTLTILGDQTGKFANGDIIDISTSDNLIRERKTLTAVPSFGGGVTTLTFSATANAFTTADFVERVDVIPKLSIVNKDAQESFIAMIHVRSIVDFTNSEVEDEYSFEAGTANEDVIAKLDLTREDVSLIPFAKRLGVTFSE